MNDPMHEAPQTEFGVSLAQIVMSVDDNIQWQRVHYFNPSVVFVCNKSTREYTPTFILYV